MSKRFRVSNRDLRIVTRIVNQKKQEDHDENVKSLEEEMRTLSGEKRSGRRISSVGSSDGSANGRRSIGDISDKSIQFAQGQSKIMEIVKDKLSKMSKRSENSRTFGRRWNTCGPSRAIIKNWSKYHKRFYGCESYKFFPDSVVSVLALGQEHEKRKVKCYSCQEEIDTLADYYTNGQECHHFECFEKLLQ